MLLFTDAHIGNHGCSTESQDGGRGAHTQHLWRYGLVSSCLVSLHITSAYPEVSEGHQSVRLCRSDPTTGLQRASFWEGPGVTKLLPQGAGWAIIIGFSALFAAFAVFLVWVDIK